VRIADLNAHGRPEISYRGFDGGGRRLVAIDGQRPGTPWFAGIRGWDGTGKHRFWSMAPPYPSLLHHGRRYVYSFAQSMLENDPAAHAPGLEVITGEAVGTRPPPFCCPERVVERRYRFERATRRWVLYERRWSRLPQ
jgi:hypothetical protein